MPTASPPADLAFMQLALTEACAAEAAGEVPVGAVIVDAAGEVIVFEANASMVVPQPERGAIWEYRRAPVAKIRAAVREMIVRRAAHAAAGA